MGRNTRNKKDSKTSKSFSAGFKSNFNSDRRFSSAPREMHKAKCADCSSDCEVPFKPVEGKPVYCKECYKKKKTW